MGGAKTIAWVLAAALALGAGCAHQPKTPFDHLYGPDWCRGVYASYAERYTNLQRSTVDRVIEAYGVLVREGVSALERLQSRSVPFYVEVEETGERFRIRREIPERLTFTAEMTEEDRRCAQQEFQRAREYLADDYACVERLEWALNRLLDVLVSINGVIQETQREIHNLALIRQKLRGGELPYELPYQVTPAMYDEVVVLLIARLERDVADLKRLETGILTVVLTTRATDGRGQSLAGNVEVAVLAAVEDQNQLAANRLPPAMPDGAARQQLFATGEQAFVRISIGPEFQEYLNSQQGGSPDPLGAVLAFVDAAYGTRLAGAAKAVRHLIEGDSGVDDYFALLKGLASVVPSGTAIGGVLDQAVSLTETAQQAMATVDKVKRVAGQVESAGEALAGLKGKGPEVLINQAGSLDANGAFNQIVFVKDEAERLEVQGKLKAFGLF